MFAVLVEDFGVGLDLSASVCFALEEPRGRVGNFCGGGGEVQHESLYTV